MNWIFRNLIIVSFLTLGVYYFIFYSETGELPIVTENWQQIVFALLLGNFGGVTMYYVNRSLSRIFPWQNKRALRLTSEILLGFIVFSLLAFLFYLAFISSQIDIDAEGSFWTQYWDGILKFGILLSVLLFLNSLVSFSMYSYNQYAVIQIESLTIERDQLNLKFEALRSQLSPHFLFNSLNTISSLAYRDVVIAEKYIRRLSATYTYLLKTDGNKLVPLSEEMEMVNSFFYMQQMKFGDCIVLDAKLSDEALQSSIPPLTIQMLVENALKHNLLCKEKDLQIEIYDREDRIIVQNNLIEKPVLLRVGNETFNRPKENSSHQIGLANIRKRYAYFTKNEIEIKRNESFIVSLPLINAKLD